VTSNDGGCDARRNDFSTGVTGARYVNDEDAPHQPRSDGRAMRAVLPVNSFELHKAEKRFVDERRGRHAAVAAVTGKARPGNTVQLAFDERHQSMQRLLVALPPGAEQRRDVVAVPGHMPP
jgi:hypothetical protein